LELKREQRSRDRRFRKEGDEGDIHDMWARDVIERDETMQQSHCLVTIKMPL
jgi:hypothetical protein